MTDTDDEIMTDEELLFYNSFNNQAFLDKISDDENLSEAFRNIFDNDRITKGEFKVKLEAFKKAFENSNYKDNPYYKASFGEFLQYLYYNPNLNYDMALEEEDNFIR